MICFWNLFLCVPRITKSLLRDLTAQLSAYPRSQDLVGMRISKQLLLTKSQFISPFSRPGIRHTKILHTVCWVWIISGVVLGNSTRSPETETIIPTSIFMLRRVIFFYRRVIFFTGESCLSRFGCDSVSTY